MSKATVNKIPTSEPEPVELNQARFMEIAGALAEYRELEGKTVLSPSTEAKLKGNKEFLANAFTVHAEEFLGAWHTVHLEYAPMLKHFAHIAERVGAILRRTNEERAKQVAIDKPNTTEGQSER
jgi:hypothetical protein